MQFFASTYLFKIVFVKSHDIELKFLLFNSLKEIKVIFSVLCK